MPTKDTKRGWDSKPWMQAGSKRDYMERKSNII